VVIFAPLVLVFAMGGMVNRMSGTPCSAVFMAYSPSRGSSLSYIF
jgi:FtsH-binding integral membrane protein